MIQQESHHASGAWIEITSPSYAPIGHKSHHASGAWIEISLLAFFSFSSRCRITQVVRGLKFIQNCIFRSIGESHHASGAWIEMPTNDGNKGKSGVASRKWCVD